MRLVALAFGAVSGWFLGHFIGAVLYAVVWACDVPFHTHLVERPMIQEATLGELTLIAGNFLGAVGGVMAVSRLIARRTPVHRGLGADRPS